MLWRPLPLPIAFLLVVMLVWHLYSTRRRKLPRPPADYDPLAKRKEENLSAVGKIVSAHTDCTAEVFNIYISGKQKVKTIRLLNPGDDVEIRNVNGDIKVYAFGEYMADLIVPSSSHLEEVFNSNIQLDAFIGGRDLAYINDDNLDICSIIIFYKLEGIPPTKVNLQ